MTIQSFVTYLFRVVALRSPWLSKRYFRNQYLANIRLLQSIQQPPATLHIPEPKPAIDGKAFNSSRLFYISPLPPDQSGIAKYSFDLLPELLQHFDLILVHPKLKKLQVNGQNLNVRSPDWFLENRQPGDFALYHIGNSQFHTYMLDLLEKAPGAVVLHDVFISHLLAHEYLVNKKVGLAMYHLFMSHGARGIKRVVNSSRGVGEILDLPCSGHVIARATRVFVYSKHARDLIADFYGNNAAEKTCVIKMPMVVTLPALTSSKRDMARQRLGIASAATLVCCFGIVQSSKRSADVLAAWKTLGWQNDSGKMLVFVGGFNAEDPYAKKMLATIQRFGALSNVKVLGWVSDSDYEDYLFACDLAVQLRSNTRGETSAALLNTLAYGVPSIINRHGSMAEIPSYAAYLLPDDFTAPDLEQAIQGLCSDPSMRSALGQGARQYVAQQHDLVRLISEFSDLIRADIIPPPIDPTRRIVWLDCSFVLMFRGFQSHAFVGQDSSINLALKNSNERVDIVPVCFNPYTEEFTFMPEALGLSDNELASILSHASVDAPKADILIVDPRSIGLAKKAIDRIQENGVRVVYAKPQELSKALKLSDQLR